jgi:hypothetical protein
MAMAMAMQAWKHGKFLELLLLLVLIFFPYAGNTNLHLLLYASASSCNT